MTVREHDRDLEAVPAAMYALAGVGAAALILAFAAFAATRPAVALPAYAQQTGLACGRCHVNPAGGGPRNAFGNAFAANGHKVASAKEPGKKTASGGALFVRTGRTLGAVDQRRLPIRFGLCAGAGMEFASALLFAFSLRALSDCAAARGPT